MLLNTSQVKPAFYLGKVFFEQSHPSVYCKKIPTVLAHQFALIGFATTHILERGVR